MPKVTLYINANRFADKDTPDGSWSAHTVDSRNPREHDRIAMRVHPDGRQVWRNLSGIGSERRPTPCQAIQDAFVLVLMLARVRGTSVVQHQIVVDL